MDPLELYEQASDWTKSKIEGAKGNLDAQTACDEWSARDLINHLLWGKDAFVGATEGKPPSGPPGAGKPPEVLGDGDPVDAFEDVRQAILTAYRKEGVLENPQAQMMAGIAFVDTLTHGWDLAKGTGQDATMPPGLADAAMAAMGGRLTPESRGDAFKPEVEVASDASAQDKLIAYMGRQPS
jgi:uncharacterized protein (TIGR03086 family)